MTNLSFDFDPPDLSEYLWPVAGALVLIELVRWAGRASGARRGSRLAITAGACVGAVLAWVHVAALHGVRGAPGAVAVLGALALVWAARSYRTTTRPLPPRTRRMLLGLRAVAIVAILIVLARPMVRWTRVREDRGTIAILLDNSRSMTVRDVTVEGEEAMETRLDALRALLRDNQLTLDRLARSRDVRTFTFDETVRAERAERVSGEGRYTALASAIESVHRRVADAGERLLGVLVVTDGGENCSAADPLAVADALGADSAALWAVGVGSELPEGQTRNLDLRRLDAPQRVALLNRVSVRGELLALGLADRDVNVELLVDDEVVETRVMEPRAPREVLYPEFEYTPTTAGLHRVVLRATANDLAPPRRTVWMGQYLTVTKDFVHVLYVDRPRYERAAIARALEGARDLRVTKGQAGRSGGTIVNRLPRKMAEWVAYDVVILGDVEDGVIYSSQFDLMRDAVRTHGRGVLVIGGERALSAGVFGATALRDVLPMASGTRGQQDGPVVFGVTRDGLTHPICRLADTPADTLKLWASLPAAPSAASLGRPKPAAAVLLATSRDEPILVVQEVGAGRAGVLGIDSTWQWSLALDEGPQIQARFWRQLVLWLANRQPGAWVSTNRSTYSWPRLSAGAESVLVEAGVTLPGETDATHDVELSGEIVATGPQGSFRAPLTLVRRANHYEAKGDVPGDGAYEVVVRAEVDGKALDATRASFTVESPDVEMQEATANFELLRQMAGRTGGAGGTFVTADNAKGLLERILATPHAVRRTTASTQNLLDRARWPILLIVVGVLVAEWFVRKRRGLP